MRPGHLNVFDGLRITTEHMNYLQGSFHSAVQDLRGIIGLGNVYEGFAVTVAGNTVTVGPGLAFDHQKNRIVLDLPATVELNFAPDENTKYVCIKYDQIDDGEVEGRFTLVWDSCSVELTSELPQPADNLVAVARIDRAGNNGTFEVGKISSGPPAAALTVRTLVRQGILRLSNTAAEASVDLGFAPLSLTCHTILNTKAKENEYSSAAQGEATFGSDGVSQFAVGGTKLIEDAIACLYFAGPGSPELLIKTNKKDTNGFSMTAEEIRQTEDQGDAFEWEALVAWKALGESRG